MNIIPIHIYIYVHRYIQYIVKIIFRTNSSRLRDRTDQDRCDLSDEEDDLLQNIGDGEEARRPRQAQT